MARGDAARDVVALLRALNAGDGDGAEAIFANADAGACLRVMASATVHLAAAFARTLGVPEEELAGFIDHHLGVVLAEAQDDGFGDG